MTLLEKRRPERGFLPSLRNNLDNLFDFEGFLDDPRLWMNKSVNVPATNIRETDKEFIVELAAPGLTKEDFHVGIDNNLLEIKVEKTWEDEEKNERYTRREYDYTAFNRSFTLPDFVYTDKINAEYRDGILKVHLPKTEKGLKRAVREILVD